MKESSRSLAPIAVFAYNRPDHLRRCVEALSKNRLAQYSDLFIFLDGAKQPSHAANVAEVRRVARDVYGFANITLIAQPDNLGLASSIMSGVSRLTHEFGKVIVVEDDLLVSPHFLQFINDALDRYADDDRVASIQAYMFPVHVPLPPTFFLKDPGCWGWATWKRGWALFESDGSRLKREIERRGAKRKFNYDGQYDYFGMLADQVIGRNDSWAVRWYASVFLSDKLVLCSGKSLVNNIGQDGSGTHDGVTSQFAVQLSEYPVEVNEIPVEESLLARNALVIFFQSLRKPLLVELAWRIALRSRRAITGR